LARLTFDFEEKDDHIRDIHHHIPDCHQRDIKRRTKGQF
jgi:hypothetical protein